jgi:hypothetical protein
MNIYMLLSVKGHYWYGNQAPVSGRIIFFRNDSKHANGKKKVSYVLTLMALKSSIFKNIIPQSLRSLTFGYYLFLSGFLLGLLFSPDRQRRCFPPKYQFTFSRLCFTKSQKMEPFKVPHADILRP